MRNLGLIITFWLASITLPVNSFALGLGEIEVNSFLNQPLNAEIKVISARAGEIDDLLVTLASSDSFKRAGLSRPRQLSDLKFSIRKNDAGDSAVILVTTKIAVKEPFLNFLIEADWSKGRLLREFTVLLDPPFYADTPAPVATASPSTDSQLPIADEITPLPIADEIIPLPIGDEITPLPIADEITPLPIVDEITPLPIADEITLLPIADEVDVSELVEPLEPSTPSTSSDVQTIIEPIALSDEPDGDSEIVELQTIIADESEPTMTGDLQVVKGDTLWSLASQVKDSEHNIDQVMLAIQRLNPGAFNEGNINNLQAGAVLRVPDSEQLDRLSKREAHVEVLAQNGLWDDYVERVTGAVPVSMSSDGGESDASSESSSSESDLSDLSLLAPGDGNSDAGGLQGDGEDANELGRQLAFAEEELEASQVQNAEMESRIAELEATLSKVQELQKMVEIEDDSLAQLQADQTAEALEQQAVEQAAAEQAIVDQALESAKLAEEQSDAEALSEDEALLEKLLAEESKTEVIEEKTSTTLPAPVIITEPVQQSDSILDGLIPPGILDVLPSMDNILSDPIMLGALIGIVVLLLILVLYKRRKGRDADDIEDVAGDAEEDLFDNEEDFTPIHLASEGEKSATDINIPDAHDLKDNADDIAPTALIPQVDTTQAVAQTAAEQDDTLNEVDVYLAYGLYDNAEDLLKQSLEANPDRADYHSKLLDTYFATKDASKFSEQAETLKSMGAAADPYWVRVQAMGYELAPENPLFVGGKDSDISIVGIGVPKPEAADFDLGATEDNTNFSTTDFNLGDESQEFTQTENFVETVVRSVPELEVDDGEQELPDLINDLDELDTSVEPAIDGSPELESELDGLEFAFDGEEQAAPGDEGAIDFELPDDMDLAEDDSAAESDDVSMDFDMEETLGFNADDLADPIAEEDEEEQKGVQDENIEATALIGMVDEFNDEAEFDLDLESDSEHAFGDIDLGMDDTSLDDNGHDSIEPTALTGVIDEDIVDSGDGFSLDLDDDAAAMDVDIDSGPLKTDTFAPGDFDDPEELAADETNIEGINIDDFDDLMLPDDADEVGTKLDLARAFIDMGDTEGARSSLEEVLSEGNEEQKAEATDIIKHI